MSGLLSISVKMNWKQFGEIIMAFAIISIMTVLTTAVIYLNSSGHLKDDSFIEEIVEEGIEQTTGIDVDLSPDSDE